MTTRRTTVSAYSTVMVALIAVMLGLAIPAALAGSGHQSSQSGGCNQNGQGHGGAYDSTCDGSASGNGSGGGGGGSGSGGGKPCAGCVGQADNKDPKGHQPGGSDSNNGYECDGNNGISKGNPAHTRCRTPGPGTPSPSPVPTCTPKNKNDTSCTTPTTPPPNPPIVCSPSAANNHCAPPNCSPSAANNQCGNPLPGCSPSAANNFCANPPQGTQPPNVSPSVQGKQILGGGNPGGGNTLNGPRVKPAASSTLPFTGANLLPWLGIGICLIGLGIVATARNRALSDPRR